MTVTSLKDAISEINNLKKKLLNFRLQNSVKSLKDTSQIKKTKKRIAQLSTFISHRMSHNDQ
jgi:ribosomal protein L29